MNGNPANTSRGAIRPDLTGDPNLPSDQRSVSAWFNTSAFSAPAAFSFGSAPRNAVDAPGRKVVDVNLQKRFAMGARAFELRLDMFNALNTPQFNAPGRIFGTPAFGTITSTGPAREIQVGARFTF